MASSHLECGKEVIDDRKGLGGIWLSGRSCPEKIPLLWPFLTQQMEVGEMKLKDSQTDKNRLANKRASYEPPKATFVPINLKERLMGCGFQNTLTCGSNAYYQ